MAQDKFRISGRLTGAGSDKKVILSYKSAEGKDLKDSALVKNGKFTLQGMTAFGNKAYLELAPLKKDSATLRRPADYQQFYLEKGNYTVKGKDSMATASITGTKVQAEHLAFEKAMRGMIRQYQSISHDFMTARSAKDSAGMKALSERARPLMANMESTLDSFIFNHGDSYVTADLIYGEKMMVVDPEKFDPYYKALSPRVLNGFTGRKITEKYDKAKQLALGKQVDFTQTDHEGREFRLSSLKGKYVLVDFWASWCVPCRAENPHLLKAYNELKSKNFEIVGVSLDDSKAAWLNAVKHDGMPWIQVSDLKGFKTDVAVKYGISAIPQNFLVNPEGIVIAKNLRGEDVNVKLAELIK